MEKIESANQEALRRMFSGDPVLVDVIPASEACFEQALVAFAETIGVS